MKRIAVLVLGCLACAAAASAYAQVVPSAYHRKMSLTTGGLGSAFQPDYAGGGIPSATPQWLLGFGAYGDLKLTRWIGVEAEARWMRENSYVDITQDNYLIGPRVPFREFKRFTPYGKALFGLGHMNFEYNEAYGRFAVVALGGGVDMKVSKRWSIRAADFEYQLWPNWINGNILKPYGVSAGIGYKVF
jgi:opacity protein-like surface antigen